ncbi:MAG: enoyl-CoA hydratase/isomerase family protein [Candidatus Binatia bacterium]
MPIDFEVNERTVVITIDRPEARNAIDPATAEELNAAWLRFRDDDELWVAVLTGAGDKSFCAGADLRGVGKFYAELTPTQRRRRSEQEPGFGGITRNLPIFKPIIAAINGHCLAGGLELAMACDFRVASPNASFGLPEVRWGIVPGGGGTQRLPRAVPLGMAMEMLMTGRPIDAETALRIGLVNRVAAAGKLLDEALSSAALICSNGPLAVRAAKEAALRGLDLSLEEGLRLEQFLAEPVRQSEDAGEGVKAFAEKRTPRFKAK